MSTQMNHNGCSTCSAPGTENYEAFTTRVGGKRRRMYQYDYRHTDGNLFSCVGASLEYCRTRRNEWINGC